MHLFPSAALLLAILAAPFCAAPAFAKSPAPAAAQAATGTSSHVIGTVASISGNTLTLNTGNGASTSVTVSDSTRLLRTEPGQKTLAGAAKIALTDLAVGDRVLVMFTPSSDSSPAAATAVIAMKQSDIAQKQQAERADWQRRGVGGLVKSVDSTAGSITLMSGSRVITVKVAPATTILRYAPDSIRFTDAKPSTLDQIHAGDQVTARGDHSADGGEVTAEEIVSGSFRNIAGTIVSMDAASSSLTVKDLRTKKQVVIHTTADSQLHRLEPTMAQMIAARLRSGGASPAEAPSGAAPAQHAAGGPNGQGRAAGGDLARVIQRAPVVQLSDLHKGDAIMIVATQGTPDSATAVTLLAGVEPMLEASASASQNMFSASWNLGGGSAGGEEGTP
ncbi:DUF5666 domain-containing protein [Paracidobacterium acidisoli]|uniref:DUF5666 domain-containing protein n=1 Tax=Paracidobacterium acidisoli TaxID=2303751 RepID=A0A372IKQ4_9BACT|nr:DUF5666 domain-containing protein [Paracidobacterium acidisoli]MBT9332887.1 hypothetical protein [Paracidobacterium acidisoli]